jgi:hypothetical protein
VSEFSKSALRSIGTDQRHASGDLGSLCNGLGTGVVIELGASEAGSTLVDTPPSVDRFRTTEGRFMFSESDPGGV